MQECVLNEMAVSVGVLVMTSLCLSVFVWAERAGFRSDGVRGSDAGRIPMGCGDL